MVMEDMLDDVLYVRKKWLKPGGIVWPRFMKLWIQPFADSEWWSRNVDYWDSKPYGIDFSPMKSYAFEHDEWPYPIRSQWRPSGLVGTPRLLSEWDLQTFHMSPSYSQVSMFRIPVKGQTVHGVLIWFDAIFDHPDGNVTLSTHPAAGVQHWGQIFWPLRRAPLQDPKLVLSGTFRAARDSPAWNFTLNWRAPPLVRDQVQDTGHLYAESFGVNDEWTTARALEGFLERDPA